MILIVDDEPDILEIFKTLLAEAGAETVCAENGALALEILKEQKISHVICDLQMPEMGGKQFLCLARKDFPYLPIYLMSAYDEQQEREFIAMGATGFLDKFDLINLNKMIQALAKMNVSKI